MLFLSYYSIKQVLLIIMPISNIQISRERFQQFKRLRMKLPMIIPSISILLTETLYAYV